MHSHIRDQRDREWNYWGYLLNGARHGKWIGNDWTGNSDGEQTVVVGVYHCDRRVGTWVKLQEAGSVDIWYKHYDNSVSNSNGIDADDRGRVVGKEQVAHNLTESDMELLPQFREYIPLLFPPYHLHCHVTLNSFS